jgi:hypothetical protein
VIRKYLEAQQVYQLAGYLQALHEAPGGHARDGHTTCVQTRAACHSALLIFSPRWIIHTNKKWARFNDRMALV